MDKFPLILEPIQSELSAYKSLFDTTLKSDNALLESVLSFVGLQKGKVMRPVLMLLMAKNFGEVGESVLHAGVSIELLHTASLVHDDVVDDSEERRGQQSVNSKFGNKVAVLSGDFLLSAALFHAAQTQNISVIQLISSLGQTLARGELLQLSNISNKELSEEIYFEVISQKTASLFAVCAAIGAQLAMASPREIMLARRFGELLGLCFQIKDDIFDYSSSSLLGKPTGNDMREGKLTLPALFVLNRSSDENIHAVAQKVKNGVASSAEITQLIEYCRSNGGIAYAENKMSEIRVEANLILDEIANDKTKNALQLYLNYVLDRDK